MTSIDTEDDTPPATLPPRHESARARLGRGISRIGFAGVIAVLLVSSIIGAAVFPIPYVALRPGSVRPVTEQVLVEGAASYPPDESIAYTTVSIGGITLLEAVAAWLDDDVDVLPEDRVRDGRSAEENRRYNAQLMDTSKLVAITVALRHLGYEVPIRTTGAVVREIVAGTPAEAVLQPDDVIVAVDGEVVDELGEIGALLQPGGPGAQHELVVERPPGGPSVKQLTIATVAAEDDPDRAVIGIAPEDRIAEFEFPIQVTIDSGNVGGPSAGLAFTLAILDVLTEGELTGGRRVAATGTIALDGSVGPVGGAAQKAITVRDAGYEVFLVPSDELEDVRAAVGDGLRVLAVDTLAEALDALDSLGGNAGSLAAGDSGDR